MVSVDGGCSFNKKISLDILSYARVKIRSQNHIQVFITKEELALRNTKNILPTCIWSEYGILLVSSVTTRYAKSYYVLDFYITRTLNSSNSTVAKSSLNLSHINGTLYRIKLQQGAWPNGVIGKTLTCLPLKTFCTIQAFLTKNVIIASCRNDLNLLYNGTCRETLWFINSMYLADHICHNISINGTVFQVLSSNLTFLNGTLFETKTFSAIITSVFINASNFSSIDSFNNINSKVFKFSVLRGHVLDTQQRACFETKYHSFTEILMKQEHCPFNLTVEGITQNLIYLDLLQHVDINITLTIPLVYRLPLQIINITLIKVKFSNIQSVDIRRRYFRNKHIRQLSLRIIQKRMETVNEKTTLHISTLTEHGMCKNISHIIKIRGACPSDKYIVFKYPIEFTFSQFFIGSLVDSDGHLRFYDLPTNYQPPSSIGKAIPLTKHVYNADPSLPMFWDRYHESQPKPEFKQCSGKYSR